jgi:type IV pilus assembly protein PilC
MADYQYEAETATGERVSGTLSAADETAARRELASRGLTIVDLLWCLAVDEEGTLHEEEVTTLVHTVGAAATSRVPLEVTLAVLAEEKDDPRLADVAHRLAVQLEQGMTIDRAVAELDQELPADVRGLMRAGIESGDLAGTFQRFTQQRLESQRLAGQIRTALAYPILIVVILVPLLLFLSIYVIPIFGELFEDFQLDLPVITQLILQAAEQLPGLIGGLLLLVLAIPIALRILGGRWLFHRVRAATPVFGGLWTWSAQREFAALLASFLDLRLPMTKAVALTGEMMSDRNVASACPRVSQRLESGQALSDCLGHSIHFDRSLVAFVAWGEQHGLLPEALRIAAEVFDDRVEQYTSLVRRLLPPITLVTVATLMFFVVIALMVPLISLIEGLSQ